MTENSVIKYSENLAPNVENIPENIMTEQDTIEKQDSVTKSTTSNKTLKANSKNSNNIPRGVPKSGRTWKTPKEKFSNVKKSLYRRSFEKKQKLREELKHIKELSKNIKANRKQENEMKKQRRIENAEKRLENERRAEVVQVINNPAKLKRMRKKQLRMIEKRDLSKLKVV